MTTSPSPEAPARQRAPGVVTLRVLAALLRYPDAQLRADLAELPGLLAADRVLSSRRQAELSAFIDDLAAADPIDAEVHYVELFDRGRSTSLHLFEHVHGDSRDRGPAMIDLGETYAQAGLMLHESELPDFLPVVVEFASTQPRAEARAFLGEIAHLLNAIHAALQERGKGYASVIGALMDLAGQHPKDLDIAPEPHIDENWSEPAAFDGCSSQGQSSPGAPQPIRIVRKAANAPNAPNPNHGAQP